MLKIHRDNSDFQFMRFFLESLNVKSILKFLEIKEQFYGTSKITGSQFTGHEVFFRGRNEGRVLKGKLDPLTNTHICTVFLNFLNYEQILVVRKIYETFTLKVIKKKRCR